MRLRGLADEDIINYKLTSMFIQCPFCDFKCNRECGRQVCQNSQLSSSPIIDIDKDKLIDRYLNNNITSAIVIGGMEPLIDQWFDEDLMPFIFNLRRKTDDDIIIYTGYDLIEVQDKVNRLKSFDNIIIKFGRFIPDQKSHFDSILGVNLASNNQHAIKIS